MKPDRRNQREQKNSLRVKIAVVLLAGVILAVCSSCSSSRKETGQSNSAGLPSIGVPEAETAAVRKTEGVVQSTEDRTAAVTQTAAETVLPGTESAPEASVSPTPPEPTPQEASAARSDIRFLSQAEIDAIRAKYDGTVCGFGTGIEHDWVDENNRPLAVNNLLGHFSGTEANLLAYCSDPNTKAVAFSFQCGTEYGHTGKVLNILDQYQVKSTFYIIHSYAEKNRSLVERMIGDGHVVGSHTYSCPNGGIARLSLEEQMEDAGKMQSYMEEAFGYTLSKFNFNSGYWSEQAVIMMSRMGYQIDFCSCNYSDYDPSASFDAAEILNKLEACLHPGCIYCFHTTNVITPTILGPLIQYCLSQGYTIVQVP